MLKIQRILFVFFHFHICVSRLPFNAKTGIEMVLSFSQEKVYQNIKLVWRPGVQRDLVNRVDPINKDGVFLSNWIELNKFYKARLITRWWALIWSFSLGSGSRRTERVVSKRLCQRKIYLLRKCRSRAKRKAERQEQEETEAGREFK